MPCPTHAPSLTASCERCNVDGDGTADPPIQTRTKKRKRSNSTMQSPKVIHLVKQKPIVKSPMFMTSPSSIYAAICRYNSILEALHGGRDVLHHNDNSQYEDNEDMLIIINVHFGGCSIFEHHFDTIITQYETGSTNNRRLSPAIIEEAFHRSVRHLCDCECFLRAYHPIREFCFLWRDIAIDDTNVDGGGSPSRRIRKENLLSGWSCQLLPSNTDGTKGGHSRSTSAPILFVSPDGKELNTKTKAINYMNKSYSTSQPRSAFTQQRVLGSTPLIDITNNINTLYSPFGLLEELFLDDPWKLLVSTICLNVTTRQQVDKVIHQYLQRWPDAQSTATANWKEISSIVSPLGLGTKRAKGLIRFSKEFLSLTEEFDAFHLMEKQVKSLYNIGQYGWTAYKVFILKDLPSRSVKVCDHALQLYVEYQLGRKASEVQGGETLSFH